MKVTAVLNECGKWKHREPGLYSGPTTHQHSLSLSFHFSKTLGIVDLHTMLLIQSVQYRIQGKFAGHLSIQHFSVTVR